MTILMYPSLERLFITTGIYYLIQLLKSETVSKLVLLIEYEFERLDINQEIFKEYIGSGKLEIISLKVGTWGSGYDYHIRCREAIKRIPECHYDILFMPDDIYILNNYLLRTINFSRLICYQTASSGYSLRSYRRHLIHNLLNDPESNKLISFLKVVFRFSSSLKKHVLDYLLFPFLSSGKLFYNSVSKYLKNGDVGRFADYYIVFSESDKRCCIEDKVEEGKIIINGHPLESSPQLCSEIYPDCAKSTPIKYDIAYFQTGPVCSIKEYFDKLLLPILNSNLKLAVKLHPSFFSNKELIDYLYGLKNRYKNLTIIFDYNFYKLAFEARTVLGENTSILEMTSYIFQNKPIVSVNINFTSIGDIYKNHRTIKYIEDINELFDLLKLSGETNQYRLKKVNCNFRLIDSLLQDMLGL